MQKAKLIISILGTVVMMYVMYISGYALQTPNYPYGIVHLPFAYDVEKANSILAEWTIMNGQGLPLTEVARLNTYYDFIYLFFYGFLLYHLCRLIFQRFRNGYGVWGNLMSKFALMAAVFDVLENVLMLAVLDRNYDRFVLLCMAGVSFLKWLTVAVVILYVFIGLSQMIYKTIQRSGSLKAFYF